MYQSSALNRTPMLLAVPATEGSSVVSPPDGLTDTSRPVISGLELRYLLTAMLLDSGGRTSLSTLVDRIEAEGFAVRGRPAKVVSDALRWDVRRGRVVRHGRGLYGAGAVPRQTKSRILHRVARMRAHVATQRHLAG